MIILFFKGALLGLFLSAPVGPINLLCMKRSLEQGQKSGFITGLGAATADTIYGSIAAFGLTFISDWLEIHMGLLSIIGAFFFFALGLLLIFSKKKAVAKEPSSNSNLYFSTVFLTLSNPAVVFSFLTAFAMIKLNTHEGGEVKTVYAAFATAGVFIGAMVWWTFLSWVTARYRHSFSEKTLRRINVGAGVLLLIFAGVILMRGVEKLKSPGAPSSSTVSSIR